MSAMLIHLPKSSTVHSASPQSECTFQCYHHILVWWQ